MTTLERRIVHTSVENCGAGVVLEANLTEDQLVIPSVPILVCEDYDGPEEGLLYGQATIEPLTPEIALCHATWCAYHLDNSRE